MPRTQTLAKTDRITVRFTPDQVEILETAAKLQSAYVGEIVEPSTLIRELVMPRAKRLVATLERRAA